MPVIESVKKALRVSQRRQKVNRKAEKSLKQALKLLKEKGMEVWPKTQSSIDKSVKAKIISKQKAGRIKSRLLLRLKKTLQKGQKANL